MVHTYVCIYIIHVLVSAQRELAILTFISLLHLFGMNVFTIIEVELVSLQETC